MSAAGLGPDVRLADAQTPEGALYAAAPIETVRIGMVGVGLQGGSHVENFLKIPGCRITAVCDVRQERTDWAARAITAAGHPAPTAYTRGARDFERLCETEDVDLVFTATPWEWHVPVMLAAMKNGQARRHRSAGGDDARRLLGARRGRGEASAPRGDDGELQLRPRRDDGLQHRPAGRARRDPARRRRLSARPARDQVREEGRRPVAARLGHEARRQSLSDARARADCQLPRHQPRRSLRLPGLDERAVARAAGLGARAPSRRRARAQGAVRRSATSTPA